MQWPIKVQGREVDEEKVRWLCGWIAEHSHWSRRKLAGELCVHWDWRDGSGRAKDLAARSFLLKMEERGWIVLPPLREVYRRPRAGIRLSASLPQEESLEASFAEVGPASLEVVQAGTEAHRRWAYYLTHHHYLGLRVVGQNVGYLARDRFGREVAALLFGAPAWRCTGRDQYLKDRGFCPQKGLERIANNTRFLIFPWVKIPHLASHILGAAARRIDGDWREKYGQGLEWLEPERSGDSLSAGQPARATAGRQTFVERGRFLGTCYRAANWVHVGSTRGRGRQDRKHTAAVPEKDVYLLGIKA